MAKMLYDFETALKALIDAQSDVFELVAKWSELTASDARYVTFHLKGKDGGVHDFIIPNFQMVVDTINERTLPPDPSFNTVRATSRNGGATLTAGSLKFAGGGNQEATYDVNGIQGIPYTIEDGDRWTSWPPTRYNIVNAGESPTLYVSPQLSDRNVPHMSDFFVYVPRLSALTIIFHSYNQSQTMNLSADVDTIWQVCMTATNKTAGIATFARAVKMEA